MKQVLIKKGQIIVSDVPVPVARPGFVLVQVAYSCISSGTELAMVSASAQHLLSKAARNPSQASGLISLLKNHGLGVATDLVKAKVDSETPTGYSCSGIVLQNAGDYDNLKPGDFVACAGAGYASHAEYVSVPRNLVMHVPKGVSLEEASTVALGGIAMQGIRRASLSLGESAAVIGVGLLGQLCLQMLKASGVKVLAIDLNNERLLTAAELGADVELNASENIEDEVSRLTDGHGVDAAIVTAASKSNSLLEQAASLVRRKGRIVLIGDVPINFSRESLYAKEIDFLISTSYGPGRYDPSYEEQGNDYPFGYVRWTENRNMSAYLELIAEGKVKVHPLIGGVYNIDSAPEAYKYLQFEQNQKPLALLKYAEPKNAIENKINRAVQLAENAESKAGIIRLGIIGAGGYAKLGHLPYLRRLKSIFSISAVADLNGPEARNAARSSGAGYCSTDYRDIISDPEIDAVLITTRHNTHAKIAEEAIRDGKAVYVEKPLALNLTELDSLVNTLNECNGRLVVGFNRRFSPFIGEIKKLVAKRNGPLIINYIVAAGKIPPESWVQGPEGGGRIIGEACHMFDIFNFLTGSTAGGVQVNRVGNELGTRDNVQASVKYSDGSVCNLIYTPFGGEKFQKETIHILWDGHTAVVNDFRELIIYSDSVFRRKSLQEEKGRREIWQAFGSYLQGKTPEPIPLNEMVSATEISFKVADALKSL